ncbi:MAG: pyridoxamine 5'-phosphate oxidase family protein [Promethearchaeota archaeon]
MNKKYEALEFIKTHRNLTMATCSKDAIPNATPHEYGFDGNSIFLEITPTHPSVQNITENPVVHFVIFEPFTPNKMPDNPQILQILAKATVLKHNDNEFNEFWSNLLENYPFMQMFKKEERVILKFTPEEGTLLEFSKRGLTRNSLSFM